MPEVRTPNQEKQIKISEDFNSEFKIHLTKLGWTDPEVQKKFIAIMNSYMLSGENASAQRVIVNYLDKGLDVLNIQLKRIEFNDENKMVQIDPDEVVDEEEPQQQQVEVTKKEFNKLLSEGRSKRLSKVNILKSQLSENKTERLVRKILKGDEKDNNELENKITEAINFILQKNVILEQGSVNSNNFRVFFNNYLNDDKGWSPDSASALIDGILKAVETASGNINAQNKLVRETDLLIDRLSKTVDIKSAEQTKNSKIAFNELATLSSKLRGWSSEFFSEFMDNIVTIVGTSRTGKIQRYVADQIKNLHSKLPKGKGEKEKEEEKTKTEKQPKKKEASDGDKDQSRGKGKEQ